MFTVDVKQQYNTIKKIQSFPESGVFFKTLSIVSFILFILPRNASLFALAASRNAALVVLGWAYRGLTGGFLLLQNFSVAISVSPHVCFILVLILISIFLR